MPGGPLTGTADAGWQGHVIAVSVTTGPLAHARVGWHPRGRFLFATSADPPAVCLLDAAIPRVVARSVGHTAVVRNMAVDVPRGAVACTPARSGGAGGA